jgi:transposase
MTYAAESSLSGAVDNSAEFALPARLPDDPAALKALLVAQQQAFAAELSRQAQSFAVQRERDQQAVEARILALYEKMRLARQRLFGRRSESHPGQGWLFNEAEALCEASAGVEAAEQGDLAPADSAPAGKQPRGKRRPLPAELPRVEIFHEVPESQRTCGCGTPMVEIGQEVSEQLDIVPMQVRVLRHIRKRYACPRREHSPLTAPAPAQVLPKSNASNELLAMLLITKYVDGLPLARFEYVLARAGVAVARQTLARWVIGTAQALQPLANLMRDRLLEGTLIQMDETPVQVLKEPGREPSARSYMWVQRGGPPGKPVILFEYDPSRSQQVPLKLLADWQGYLMVDGYEGYNAIEMQPGVIRLGCWAHARRDFVDATKVLPPGKRGRAHQALSFIAKLYAIEKRCRALSGPQRQAMRQHESTAVMNALRGWLDEILPTVPATTALGQALVYLHNQWPRLRAYLERADLPIDNNGAENAIRPFVVGRKAWLFADTPAGAHASALIYSLVETAKANGLEPYLWLRNVLRHLPLATTAEDFEVLLPWNQRPFILATE